MNRHKNKTHTYTVFKRPTSGKEHIYTESERGWKKIFHANRNQKKAGVAILISDKMDLKECSKMEFPSWLSG